MCQRILKEERDGYISVAFPGASLTLSPPGLIRAEKGEAIGATSEHR
jgi:hypothetical protein